jgi:hypothetical protein
MKNLLRGIIIFIPFVWLSGCENADTVVEGTGSVVTKNLDLSAFDKIENIGVANFYIIIGEPQTVVLKAQQNIIDVLTYEVVNRTLKVGIKNNVSIRNHEEIRFEITTPEINQVELIGVGDFTFTGPDQDALTILLTGVGQVKAFDMRVGNCYVASSGVGDCEVFVLDNLDVTITGVGNVYYKGNPTISSSITGLGQLINAN